MIQSGKLPDGRDIPPEMMAALNNTSGSGMRRNEAAKP